MAKRRINKAFSKTIALALALLLASTTLTGCDLFSSRQKETENSEIELEAPEPDKEQLEELEGEEELSADVDPNIEDKDQTEEVVEEPEQSKPSGSTTSGTESASKEDHFIDTSYVFNNKNSSKKESTTTSALIPETVIKPEKMNTVFYQPVGTKPAEQEETKLLAQPTGTTPKPVSNKSYKSARFKQKGTYSESKIYKNGYIDVGSVTISNKTFTGDLYIDVDSGSVTLKNVDILGKIYIIDGSDWVKLYDVHADGLVADNSDTSRVFASRDTEIDNVTIKSNAVLEEGGMYSKSRGFANVTVNAKKGTTLTLKNLRLNKLKTTTACDVVYDNNTVINYLYTNAPTELYGYGQVNRLYCNSNGVYYDAKPLYIETGRGYATPSKRTSSGNSGSHNEDKKVVLHDINHQYLDIGEKKVVGIDHNGTSLRVTTSDSSVAKVTYSTSKSHITMTGVKPGKATIKVTSSRAGYKSSTISFNIIVKENNSNSIQLSPISSQYMDENTTRYVTVNTNASRISVSNSNSKVAEVVTDGFQLKIRAKDEGTTTVKVVASRSGRPSKSTTFKIVVRDREDDNDDTHHVYVSRLDNQILNKGNQKIINVNTNATSIKATSSNDHVAKVSTRNDDSLIVEAVAPGSAWIEVKASRRGYRDTVTGFRMDVYGNNISAPSVDVRYAGINYPNGQWTNQDVSFYLNGYNSSRIPYYNERQEGASNWSGNTQLSNGTLTVKNEGRMEYRFFTTGDGGNSEITKTYTVRIDKTAPNIIDIENKNGVLKFRTTDNLSGAKWVSVTENGTSYTIAPTDGIYTFVSSISGNHKVQIHVRDEAGNLNIIEREVNKSEQTDISAPTISITSLLDENKWYRDEQQVKFSVTDDSGKADVTLSGASLLHEVNTNNYSFIASTEGVGSYTITAKDASGKKSERTVGVKIDKTAPVLSDISVREIPSSNDKEVIVKVTEVGSGIQKVKAVSVNDQTTEVVATNNNNGTYTFRLAANKKYTITAIDNAGNESPTQQVTLEDATVPTPPTNPSTVSIETPKVEDADTISKEKAVTFTVNATTKAGETLTVSIKNPQGREINPIAALSMKNTYVFTVSENGTYSILASVTKDGRSVETANQVVTINNIDTTAPRILVTENKNGIVEFTVTEEALTGNAVRVTCDGDMILSPISQTTQGNVVAYNYKMEKLMTDQIVLKATDSAGNSTTQEVVVVKQSQPTIKADNSNLYSTDGKAAQTMITVDPQNSKVKSVQVDKSGASVQKTAENRYQFTATENGEYTVHLLTEDNAAASVKINVNGIKKNTIPPTIHLGEYKLNDTMTQVQIPITISDSDSGNAITLSANKGTVSGNNNSYILTATENGNYIITARDADANEATVSIAVDEIKGHIAPVMIQESVTSEGKNTVIRLQVNDNGGSEIVSVADQNGTQAVNQGNGIYLLTVLASGNYTITAKNRAGKTASVTVTVQAKDTTAPTIYEPVITYNETKTQATVSVTVKDSDDTQASGVKTVTFTGNNMIASDDTYQATVFENGTYTITATDNAGNPSTKEVTVSGIDKTAPVIQVTSKHDNWQKKHTVTFLVTDEGSGVASVQVTKDGAVQNLNTANGYSFDVTENGRYIISTSDLAGNAISKEIDISTIDKAAPEAPILKNVDKAISTYNAKTGTGQYNTTATSFAVGYKKAAAGESPVVIKVKIDSAKEFSTVAENNMNLTLNEGTHTIVMKAVDAAGNESAAVTYKIIVEKKQ